MPKKSQINEYSDKAIVEVICWELNYLFKTLVLPTFTYGIKIWEGNLKTYHWKVCEKGMKIHMMFHIKVRSLTTCHNLLT